VRRSICISLNGGFYQAKNGHIIFEKYEGLANYKTKLYDEHSSTFILHLLAKVITATAV
jgi:hypothetical protein